MKTYREMEVVTVTFRQGQFRRLFACFPPQGFEFDPRTNHVGFKMDEVALGQVFAEYFGFPYQFLFHKMLHIH
jgi:hypothetical protein